MLKKKKNYKQHFVFGWVTPQSRRTCRYGALPAHIVFLFFSCTQVNMLTQSFCFSFRKVRKTKQGTNIKNNNIKQHNFSWDSGSLAAKPISGLCMLLYEHVHQFIYLFRFKFSFRMEAGHQLTHHRGSLMANNSRAWFEGGWVHDAGRGDM